MGKIRVVHVTENLGVGGLERVVSTLCQATDPDRFEPAVLCLRFKGAFSRDLEARGIVVVDVGAGNRYTTFVRAARALRRLNPDVIHTHNTPALLDGWAAARIARVGGLVHTDHARDFPDKLRYMAAEWFISRWATRFVGVSEHTTANLARYERIPVRKLLTIQNGIDPAPFRIDVNTAAKKRELGLPTEGHVVGACARLTRQKGFIYLLRALSELPSGVRRPHLVLAGKGELEQELRAAARDLGIADHVHFLGVRTDVAELLKVFDLFMLPSLWEGLPMALLEAMAAGCPIVASNVGGVAGAIQHGVTGALVQPRDPRALASEMARLLADQELRRRYARAAHEVFKKKFSAAAMASRYEDLYVQAAAA